jgi:hypothetical protein
MSEEYLYSYEPKRALKEDEEVIEEKKEFVVVISYTSPSDILFAHIIEGYKLPYSYEVLFDGDPTETFSEYTFPIDLFDVIKVIIDMRSINVIKII